MELAHFPTLNASLNALTTVLLCSAFIAVKRGHKRLHGGLMITALVTSAVFLGCYLYYHFMKGEPTRYPLHDWSRPVYLAILVSHTILATAALPFILAAFYQAFRRNWEKHRRLVRWVWPVWIYVSFTGVLVYWMLYHFAGAAR